MKILVPIDGSSYSENSLEFVASRATLLGKNPEIELLVVLAPLPTRAARLVSKDSLMRYYEDEAEKIFKPARKFLKTKDVEVTEAFIVGDPAEKIAEEATKLPADLIIMGTRGEGPVRGLLFGSVSNAVVARSHRPILILRDKLPEGKKGLRVGIAADGSEFSQVAVDYVIKNRKLFGEDAKFELINAGLSSHPIGFASMAGMMISPASDEEMKRYRETCFHDAVDKLEEKFKAAGITPKLVSLEGEPGPTIADYATKEPLDLLVMGSHGYGNFRAAVLGSVAMRIASQSSVPLLIIRK